MFLLKIGIQLENHIKNQRENVEICQKVLKYGTSNDENLSKKTTSERTDPFGVAATLELTHSYVKDNNYTPKYSADKESNFLNQQN